MNGHAYLGPRIKHLPCDNGRFSGSLRGTWSFDPATLNPENFPESFTAHQPVKSPEPIPVASIKDYRGTQHQYEQRGMVLNAPMRMKGRRIVMHNNRMRNEKAAGEIRRFYGIHHPTDRQIEMKCAGASITDILATVTVRR